MVSAVAGTVSVALVYGIGRRLDLELHAFELHAADRHLVTGRQYDFAAFGLDDPAVLDVRRNQYDVSALPRLDPALVDDRACAFSALELELAREEVAIEHLQARADEARGVDHRARADQDAGGIDEEDAAVGLQRSVDLGDVGRSVARLVDGADHGLERVRKQRLLLPPACLFFAAAEFDELAQLQTVGDDGRGVLAVLLIALDVSNVYLHEQIGLFLGLGRGKAKRCDGDDDGDMPQRSAGSRERAQLCRDHQSGHCAAR